MARETLANWNGEILPLAEVRVSVLDRAFLFGDAVYEAIRVYDGEPFLAQEHMDRLRHSLAELRISADVDRIDSRMRRTLTQSGVAEGMVYLQVTRGEAPRTHSFPKQPVTPNELIWIADLGNDPYADFRETGVGVITFADMRWERRDIKSVNLLGNCLACQTAAEAGCVEAILVEPSGKISEGSHTSVFAVMDGCLLTAPKGHHILPGITRELVLQLAQSAQVPLREHSFTKDDLDRVEELFLTGTTTEVLGISRVDGKAVGAGVPGPVTKRMYQAYRERVRRFVQSRVRSAQVAAGT